MDDINQEQPITSDEVQATEQEQAQLAKIFDVSLGIIHSEGQTGDKIADMVLSNQDVSIGIGGAASAVLIATEKQVGQIPDDMKIQLSLEIIAELSGLAVEAGALSEDEVNDGFIDAVVSNAYSSYITTKESMGDLDPAELERNVSEAEQLMGTSVRNNQQSVSAAQPEQGGLMSMVGG